MKLLFWSDEHPAKRKIASQIALHYSPGDIDIYQTKTSYDASDHALIKVLAEMEIAYREDAIKNTENIREERYDMVIVLCPCFRSRMLTFCGQPTVLCWPVENPAKKGSSPLQLLTQLRKCRDELVLKVRHLYSDGYLETFARQREQQADIFNDPSRGCLLFNRDEIIVDVNERAASLSGHPRESLFGKPLHYVLPDDTVSRHALAIMDEGILFREVEMNLMMQGKNLMRVMATFAGLPHALGQGGLVYFQENHEANLIQPLDGTRGLDRLSWDRVESALRQSTGNRTKAAHILGVGRATLYRFLDRHKKDVPA